MKSTPDTALQVAIEMERLAQTLYESLAAVCGQSHLAAIATTLAKAETIHLRTFEGMRKVLPPDQRGRKLTEAELLAAVNEFSHRILPIAQSVREVALGSDVGKALDMAMKMESDAIAYYTLLASGVTGSDAATFKNIIEEEKEHLTKLQQLRTHFVPSK